MKKIMTIILLTLIANHAMGQVDYSKKTDRFGLSSTLRYQRGKEINKELIEMFKYAGNLEGKRWWTGYYVPKQEFPDKDASEEVKEAMRKKRRQDMEEYEDKEEEMQRIYPCYQHLFINATSFYPPRALSYDSKDTTLVTLSPGKETASFRNIEMGKNVVRTMKMKVDKETYNAIQTLHMLVIYTAVPMDAISGQLDGTLYYITWSDWRGDHLVQSPSGAESATAKRVLKVFDDIMNAVGGQNQEELQALMPTVHELIAHYRSLLHPDVIVDEKLNLDMEKYSGN